MKSQDEICLEVCRALRHAGSVAQLAEKMEVSTSAILRWVCGKQRPTPESWANIKYHAKKNPMPQQRGKGFGR